MPNNEEVIFLLRHLKEWILFLQLVSIPVVLMPKINLLENGNLTVGSLISSQDKGK